MNREELNKKRDELFRLRASESNHDLGEMWNVSWDACLSVMLPQLDEARAEIKSYDDSGRKQWHTEKISQLQQELADKTEALEYYRKGQCLYINGEVNTDVAEKVLAKYKGGDNE